jgi:ribosomal-protein-alanine N-acetyltransferase
VIDVTDHFALVPDFPVLDTRRLRLRQIGIEAVDWYLGHFSRPEIVVGTGFPAPGRREDAARELQAYVIDPFEARTGIRWGVTSRESDVRIGSIGFYRWTDGPPALAELGYELVPEHWGRGLMSEALAAVLAFGFGVMRLERVMATVLPRNDRSIRLLERAGFAREGLLREHGTDEHGRLTDEWLFVRAASPRSPHRHTSISDPTSR